MLLNEKIEFDKERSLAEILKDSYLFFRLNLSVLIRPLLIIVGPLALISSFYNAKMRWYLLQNKTSYELTEQIISESSSFYFFSFLAFAVLMATVVSYIKLYMNDKTGMLQITIDMLWREVWRKIWGVLVVGLLGGILIGLGLMLLVFPGIWLMVPVYIALYIVLFESKPATDSFAASFQMIKNKWLEAFGVILVLFLINIVVSTIIFLPLSGYDQMISEGDTSGITPKNYIIMYMALNMITYLVGVYATVAGAFLYFSLKNKTQVQSSNPV